VPMPFIFCIIVLLLVLFLVKKTKTGRYIYAIGNSREAATILGIKVDKIRVFIYVAVGLISSLAGLLYVCRLGSAQSTLGESWPMNSIAASVIGGVSLNGGIGNPAGALIGAAIISIISKSYQDDEKSKIFSIIATLVSSQTDADRMDYLLRDSYFTSVTNGSYDIQRLIKSFGVKEEKDKLKIYINEKYMSTLEEYVLARYFMHKEVYQHNIKQHMESCLKLIFKRVKELIKNDIPVFCDDVAKKLILGKNISVSEYLQTDDSYFMYHISKWKCHDDIILSHLSNCFINRIIFDKEIELGEIKLKEHINDLLEKNGIEKIKNLNDEYFYIKTTKKASLYTNSGENIWIKSKEKEKLYDLTEKSLIINKDNVEKSFISTNIFISSYLFEQIYGIKFEI